MRTLFFLVLFLLVQQFNSVKAQDLSVFRPSTAGFYKLENSDARLVYNFNNGWRFHRGDIADAWKKDFDMSQWQQVQLPHGIETLSREASGGANYQGSVWYRKKFTIPEETQNKRLVLHFEAIMSKCKIWVNGNLVKEHKGGYLPIILDLDRNILEKENYIAVMADNSNDGSFPIGKPQYELDFTYLGGIYRDVWLLATNTIFITDPNQVDKTAGGGVFVHADNISEKSADVSVKTDVQNNSGKQSKIVVENYLQDETGNIIARKSVSAVIKAGQSIELSNQLKVNNPSLWSLNNPYLYKAYTIVKESNGNILDGYFIYTGIRKIEFRGAQGFFLNGKKYEGKLIGANHHQDYALIGNALSNNLHWYDVKLMRDAGIKVARGAHYPQDPAFMDACDRFGVFVIPCVPGWQFWNEHPSFEQMVLRDIKNMIRRDRNRASVLLWEPLLNETGVLGANEKLRDFTKKAYETVRVEFPFKDGFAATDSEHDIPETKMFDVIYAHPAAKLRVEKEYPGKSWFTREWGDNVDDFYAHNSNSRAAIGWGEVPQLVQAMHYAVPHDNTTSFEVLYNMGEEHVGGSLWHFFDHERGYHPDPFWGGIVDNFRQKKYSYHMFESQQSPDDNYFKLTNQTPYKLFIANEMSPFSPEDVTVFTNCDSVRLIVLGRDSITQAPDPKYKMPHAPIVFKDVYKWGQITKLVWSAEWPKRYDSTHIVAKGFKNGEIVIETTKIPTSRPVKYKLSIDDKNLIPFADGSTIIPVVASVVDEWGKVKRLNNSIVRFRLEGEGVILNREEMLENPKKIEWGSAVALIRTTLKPGEVKIIAEPLLAGDATLKSDSLVINTVKSLIPGVYETSETNQIKSSVNSVKANTQGNETPVDLKEKLKQVSEEQKKFGEQK